MIKYKQNFLFLNDRTQMRTYPTGVNTMPPHFLHHIQNALSERRPGGDIRGYAGETLRIFCKNSRSAYGALALLYYLVAYGFGSRAAAKGIRAPAYKLGLLPCLCKQPGKTLYHWAPTAYTDAILRQGLKGEPVFLTDDPAFIRSHGYFGYKEAHMGCPTAFVLFAVDTDRLPGNTPVFHHAFCPHEYYTASVPPDCLHPVETDTRK